MNYINGALVHGIDHQLLIFDAAAENLLHDDPYINVIIKHANEFKPKLSSEAIITYKGDILDHISDKFSSNVIQDIFGGENVRKSRSAIIPEKYWRNSLIGQARGG